MKPLYPEINNTIECAYEEALSEVITRMKLPAKMIEGMPVLDEGAPDSAVIEFLRMLRNVCYHTSCKNSFIVGDAFNKHGDKRGDKTKLLIEAFGIEGLQKARQFFAPKASVAKACPEPRDYSLPWSYYKRKAAMHGKKFTHSVGTTLFHVMCVDTEGIATGLIVERENDYLIIRCEDSDDIMIPMAPLRDLIFEEYRKSKNNEAFRKGMIMEQQRAAYATGAAHDDFAESAR